MTRRWFCLVLLLSMLGAAPATAGSDAAVVPDNRIPWSGYWWPRNEGALVNGYSEQPAPMEKYDAFVSGYYPAEVMTAGIDREYDPASPSWYGYCDAWAAASILEAEPGAAGRIDGIPFNVGDKKGLLTAFYNQNYTTLLYGTRYTGKGEAIDDIHPGGINGFHQTLINYIAIQGLPIIADVDPGVAIWSYPVYRYDMTWTDTGNTRHVTCTIWMADDFVSPDFVGTRDYSETYTYDLALDENGDLLDQPGQWTGASIDNHPDFLWFPASVGTSHPYLDEAHVRTIVASGEDDSDDIYEPNNTSADATTIDGLVKNKFYWASARDEDWYDVALAEGDYFYAFILSPADDIDVRIYDPSGNPIGTTFYHGARIDSVPQSGYYHIQIIPQTPDGTYYNIEFFTPPSDNVAYVAGTNGWETRLNLVGREWYFDEMRVTLFNAARTIIDQVDTVVPEFDSVSLSLMELFGDDNTSLAASASLTNLDADYAPYGFVSYANDHRIANIPLGVEPQQLLYLPRIRRHQGGWYTGVALMNVHRADPASVTMTVYSTAGQQVGESHFNLAPMGTSVGLIESFGPMADDAAWVKFSADQPLRGIVLWNRDSGGNDKAIAGIPLLGEAQSDRTLYLPHLADHHAWETEAVLLNANAQSVSVTVTGYDATGAITGTGTLSIPAGGSWQGSAENLVEGSAAAWLKITASMDICGYQMLSRRQDSLAALPMLTRQSMQTEHLVKVVNLSANTWTGLVMVNDSDSKSDIWAIPCDAEGNNLLGNRYLWYNSPAGLGAKCNIVGYLDQVFPGIPPETVTLKIYSDEPILGFALSADESRGQLDVLYLD